MDHLSELCGKSFPDSKIAQGMACGRTKTTAITKRVIGHENFQNICEDLRKTKFSLIIDESTDRTTQKHLCLVVRYAKNNIIGDHFFCLIPLINADANTLYKQINDTFTMYKISLKNNLIGFASDGANVMMGANHSVMALLKNDIPSLYVMKCICHSFHLCASYACHKLPKYVEDFIRDLYNYFSSSPKRTAEFVEFQTFCDVKVHKLLHPSQTRWLSVHSAINRILEQFEPLKLFFIDAVTSNDVLAAENILEKLQDPETRLFLEFLDFVLPLFNGLNREMQSESPKIHVIFKNVCTVLKTLYESFLKRSYINSTQIENIEHKNPRNFLPLEEMYLGAKVNISLIKNQGLLSKEKRENFYLKCLDFFVEGCSQILNRFPLRNNILKKMTFLDPEIVKNGSVGSIADIVSNFPNLISNEEIQTIDTEWRLLRNHPDIKEFDSDCQLFWSNVRNLRLGNTTVAFPTLCKFVQNILCLPHSSANVERVFSAVNLLKTNQRNRLESSTISGILQTKQYLGSNKCYNFEVNRHILSKMNDHNLKSSE